MSYTKNTFNTSLTAIALSIASASYVQAAGFAVNDQSATASGAALAGAAAMSDNISGSYWNPALLGNAKDNSFYASGALILPEMDVTVNSAVEPNLPAPLNAGSDISSLSSGGDVVDPSLIPSLYFAHRLSDKTVAGVAYNTPFGFSTEYDSNWAGQIHGTKTRLVDSVLSFSLAHQMNERLSVGASVQYHSAEVELDSSIVRAKSTTFDFDGEITADATAVGYSIGVLFEPQAGTRLGVGYRSEVEFDFEGEVEYSAAALASLGSFGIVNADVSDNITLPSMLTFSAEHEYSPKINLMATAIYTGWSSMDELRIDFDSNQPDSVLTFDFEDQWFYSVGGSYQYSEQLTLRAGLAYDNSPVKDEYRSVRTPDGDRQWLSFGATYDYSETTSISASYTHVMVEDVNVNRDGSIRSLQGEDEDSARGTINADYESSANVLSLALNMEF
ncbi:aromatic hydrocarbon degradation protein [Marinomonas agarivorans]|nr:aromatic hydrocarbon degradation protein [Marinomonas agarivorans]